MDKKKIAIGVGIVVVVGIIINLAIRQSTKKKDFLFDKNSDITLNDVKSSFKRIQFTDDNVKEYFSNKIINPYTIKFFQSIELKFKDSKNWDEHYEQVREYLNSVLSPEDAKEMFALYKKYMDYQQKLVEDMKSWSQPKSPMDAIGYLHKLQDYRRNFFGKENADVMWGAEMKAKEYPIRRGIIISDGKMYGAEKEKKIKQLNADMWGADADDVENYAKPYVRYQEKLSIYQKDLGELKSDEERQQKIREFRKEIFTPEVVERLDGVDKIIADEKKREEDYFAKEKDILSNPNYKKEEKEEKIRELQNGLFGDEADAFRRRLNYERTLEEMKNKR